MSQGNTDSNLPRECTETESTTRITPVNFPSMRVTSLPFNKVEYLPDILESREEVELAAYKTEVMELVKR